MLVSIIIPCYNVEDYIEECISSVLSQTYSNTEIICVDNNSEDLTVSVLQRIKRKYPKIQIEQEHKPGAPAARNKGLKLAKGEWLQFLDADDLLLPDKIAHQLALLETNSQDSFIAGAYYRRDLQQKDEKYSLKNGNPFKSLFISGLGITSSNLWNAEMIRKIDGWDESFTSSQDADLMFRLLQQNINVILDNKPLTIIRRRPSGQISQINSFSKWNNYNQTRLNIIKWLEDNKPAHFEEYKNWYEEKLFDHIRTLARNDVRAAQINFEKYLGKDFRPNFSFGRYKILFYVFGFSTTEKIYNLFSRT